MSLPEQIEFSNLLSCNPHDEVMSSLFDEVFNASTDFTDEINEKEVQKSLGNLHDKINASQKVIKLSKSNRFAYWRSIAAAAIVLILGSAFYFLYPFSKSHQPDNIVATQKGSKSTLILPDGTKVWVNADTKLTYDNSFGKGTREVSLIGEAYFDVVKDKANPFIVHTNTIDVKVLGTAFNVRAYENEKNTQTTLLRGAVEVLLKQNNNERVFLKPNEKIIVQNNSVQSGKGGAHNLPQLPAIAVVKINITSKDSVADETQWVRNRLSFNNQTLEDILPMIERWYNVKVVVKKPLTTGIKFNGTFENDSLEDVMRSLQLSAGFNYTIEKDKIIIY